MNDIAVIIVNWNACADLRVCLTSIAADPKSASTEVWVVDNASTDGSAAMVAAEFPWVRLMANTDNVGFSKGNNVAIEKSESRYVFLLNSDAAVHLGALDALVRYADANPKAAIIGPKVLNPNGSIQFSCRRFPVIWAGFYRNTLLGKLVPNNKYAGEYLMTDFDHASVRSVDWVSGCAMFIRRSILDEIGGPLDERFYMYCEDVDICQRCWDKHYEVVYVPEAIVTHAIGRSSDKNAEKMIREFHKSWYEYDMKRHPNANIIRKAVVGTGLWLRASVRIINRRRAEFQRQRSARQEKAAQ